MNKLKKGIDYFVKFGISVLIVAFLLVSPFTIMTSLLKSQSNVNRVETFEYQGILELWHIETFEGGSASRINFLEKQAIKFEREHRGTYIVIENMSLEQLQLNLKNGKTPDMISFGIGVGEEVADKLISLKCSNIRSDLLEGGKFCGKQLAVPYILGGYAIVQTNAENSGVCGVGMKGAINPFKAVEKNGKKIKLFNDIDVDTYTAYDRFLKGQFNSLLGTQRDVYRIYNRQQKGLLNDVSISALGGYTDLVQYFSIFKTNSQIENMCNKFLTTLTSFDVQTKLANINMFSVRGDVTLYNSEIFCEMEKVLGKNLEVNNVFKNQDVLQDEIKKFMAKIGE